MRLDQTDDCYYAREYISRGGFNASEANQLISNFKKLPSTRKTWQWPHKERAILRFATELARIIPGGMTVAAIPTSKREDDPEYDSRLDDTLRLLHRSNKTIRVEHPFEVIESHQSAHTGGDRSPEEIYRMLRWKGLDPEIRAIMLVDDVITTGSHFKACQRLIREEHGSDVDITGVFWAKTVWPEVEFDILI